MPMADCDRVKVHVSDYLENQLSPQLKKEFQSHLKSCAECKIIVEQVHVLKSLLAKSTQIKCSDDFNLKLRQKISESDGKSYVTNSRIKQISFGFSFAAVVFLVFFGMNFFTDNESNVNIPAAQVQSKEIDTPPSGSSQLVNHSAPNVIASEEFEVKTKNSDGSVTDTTNDNKPKEKDDRIKYVDSK